MAITKLTYNSPSGITFNNVSSPGASDATFIGKSKILAGFDKQISQSDLNEYGLTPILQALQIDWNGAQVAGQTLNNTGEVLSMLGYAYTANGESKDITLKIGNTEKTFNVNETSNVEWTLKEIGAAAESHTHTGEYAPNVHTHTNYQEKLISGDNIKTINGNSILGSGNITISEGSSVDLSNYYTIPETNTYFISPEEMSYYVSQQGYITSVPKATNSLYGTIKIGFTTSGNNYAVKNDTKGNAYVNVPWTDTKYDTEINSINDTLTSINTTIEALAARITALEQNNTPVNIPVESITIEPSSYSFYGSEVEKIFTANVLPSNATNKSIKWSFVNNNSYVQKVSETNNTITLKSIWTFNNDDIETPDFNLKATALDGSNVYGTTTLNIKNIEPAPTSTPTVPVNQTYVNIVKINSNDSNYPEEIHLYGSTSYKLTYTITPQDADDKRVEFSFENGIPNSNTWALLNSSTGELTTRGVSDSLIVKATAKDRGTVSDTIRINIHNGELKSFNITATTTELPAVGGSAYFYITNEVSTKFASQDKTNYEWSLEKVTIEGGISTYGINEPVSSSSNAPNTSESPTTIPGTSDSPNLPTEPYLTNTTGNDTTVVFPANTTTSPITYRITAIGDGEIIRETLITVDAAEPENILVKSITIEPSSYTFYGSEVSYTFTANVLPSNATDKSINWTFDNNNSYVQIASSTNNTVTVKSIWNFNNDDIETPDFKLKGTAKDGSNVFGTATLNVAKNIVPEPTTTPTVPATATYYWYAGQDDPTTMTSISPIVTDTTSPGWRSIGTSIPVYSSTNMLYNPNVATIVTGTSLQYNYIVIPVGSSAIMRDGAGNPGTSVNLCTLIGTKTIENVEYNIYKTNSKAKKIGYPIY